ncbi:hypothetical protein E2C01_093329 [Portunus trituberculatus]|uniref:Uncharacterized protein n=1 Tax=Portunus trituberculatus TaxID=210409 RepID=A0A5B7JPI2_PORTR|nr:hypothetical protein [Portunus trituberculatus]
MKEPAYVTQFDGPAASSRRNHPESLLTLARPYSGGLRQPSNSTPRASLHLHHLEDAKGEKEIKSNNLKNRTMAGSHPRGRTPVHRSN